MLQKSAIVFAGPFANFLFAVVLFFVLFQSYGIPISSSVLPIVDKVLPNSAASKYDIKSENIINFYSDYPKYNKLYKNKLQKLLYII